MTYEASLAILLANEQAPNWRHFLSEEMTPDMALARMRRKKELAAHKTGSKREG